MIARPIIAVDIDDVVANVIDSVRLWAVDKTGVEIDESEYRTKDDYWNYYNSIWARHGLAEKINFDMVLDELAEGQSHIVPIEGAHKALQVLKKHFDIVFITSRPVYQKDATRRWLDERIDAEIPVYFSHNPMASVDARSKGEICMDLGISYLIDDNVGNCQNAEDYGVTPLLFGSYGWNDDAPERRVRCRTWRNVEEYFDGVLTK